MKYGISREEEANFPIFNSHDDARKFFKDKYGDDFQMVDSYFIDDKKIYFYKLILNRKVYFEIIDAMEKGMLVEMNEERIFCTQDIQIFESGHLHIIH